MEANARRVKILGLLTDVESMPVEALVGQFEEASITIRRDLAYLEAAGEIVRGRGVVKLVNPSAVNHSALSDEKQSMAAAAAKMVRDYTCIALDAGRTTVAIASLLGDRKGLTVATNSTMVAEALCHTKVDVFVAAGELNAAQHAVYGPLAEAFFENICASIAFINAASINARLGPMTVSPFHASVKRAMCQSAQKVVLLYDPEGHDSRGISRICNFEEVDAIIVPKAFEDAALLERLASANVEVILAE